MKNDDSCIYVCMYVCYHDFGMYGGMKGGNGNVVAGLDHPLSFFDG